MKVNIDFEKTLKRHFLYMSNIDSVVNFEMFFVCNYCCYYHITVLYFIYSLLSVILKVFRHFKKTNKFYYFLFRNGPRFIPSHWLQGGPQHRLTLPSSKANNQVISRHIFNLTFHLF
jgi:hypothetical protein